MSCLISGSVRHDVVCVNALFSCKLCFLSGLVSQQKLIDLIYFQFSAMKCAINALFVLSDALSCLAASQGGGGEIPACRRVGDVRHRSRFGV